MVFCPPPPNLCLAVSYIECPYRSFNGRFGPLADDLAQYLRMSSSLLNSSGGTQHSTCRSVMEVDLYAPVTILSAADCIRSNRASLDLDAYAYA